MYQQRENDREIKLNVLAQFEKYQIPTIIDNFQYHKLQGIYEAATGFIQEFNIFAASLNNTDYDGNSFWLAAWVYPSVLVA